MASGQSTAHFDYYGRACRAVFTWGKVPVNTIRDEVRRECPVCGFRQVWSDKAQTWTDVARNYLPGDVSWVDHDSRNDVC